jgi:hypothetical protein
LAAESGWRAAELTFEPSDPEIAEAVLVAAALRAGGAITHGTHAMKGT